MKLLPPILVHNFSNAIKVGARVKPKKAPQSFSDQLWQIAAFCGKLRRIAAKSGELRRIAIICGNWQ
jgi:hypothetical protein